MNLYSTRHLTSPQTKQNVRLLIPYLWGRLDEHTKQQFGIKYSRFLANNDQEKQKLAREFLETVSGLSYIPDNIRAAEIQIAIENLLSAHRGVNNFYNEPPFALQLKRLLGEAGKVPSAINNEYVLCLVEVFLTNGNGRAWNAEIIYQGLLEQFDPEQALIAILSFNSINISNRLQHSLCQKQLALRFSVWKVMLGIEAS